MSKWFLSINDHTIAEYFPLVLYGVIMLVWLAIVYQAGDWRNWRKYYPTILFFACGDLIYNVVFYEKMLWVFKNPSLSHKFTDFLCVVVVFTCTILIYLPHYPKPWKKQILYVGYWVLLYSTIEWLFTVLGGIKYDNGWSLTWSVIHNIYQFILIRIHQDRPLLAWTLAIIILFIITRVFHVAL